ncbi:uncharacterized protein LOC141685013 [Apium graveolens]|uniref:uncharacterized protein LOC141685013 n=1 Tax=Apium graveolens TaxID=4045 RepID=UPI003D7B644E
MEIDGKISEIGGEVDILIKSCELRIKQTRDKCGLNDKQIIVEEMDGDKDSDNENVVIESKRKRVDKEVVGENNRLNIVQLNEKQQQDGPKTCYWRVLGSRPAKCSRSWGGGIALLWRNEGAVQILNSCKNFIDFEASNEQAGRWRYTGYYGFPERAGRIESWYMLREFSVVLDMPWCIIGDFNDIISMEEKQGGSTRPRSLMAGFFEAIMDCGLHDLGFWGDLFIWERSRGQQTWVQERLDRGMAMSSWIEIFPLVEVKVLEVTTSDHLPLLLQLHRKVYVQRGRRFKFENMWLEERECRSIVQTCWSEEGTRDLMEKISRCCMRLEECGGGLIHEIKIQMGIYGKEMQRYRSRTDTSGIQKYNNAHWQYMKLLEKQEIFGRQREKQFWLRDGEKNTRFYHKFASTRKEHNKIKKLKNKDGEWKETYGEIQGIITDYFSHMFTSTSTGRLLTDNALIAYEINHYIQRKTQGKIGVVGLKVDISKAYDRLEWSFLELMMRRFKFPDVWVERVMQYIKIVTYSFLRNGEIFGEVISQRGIRQGDPISLYLYILCAEGLSAMIREYEKCGLLHGCKIARNAPSISHLLFADDCYFFLRATKIEAQTLKSMLQRYEAWLG